MTTADRQPKGIPAGGQFAPSTHGEPDVDLAKPVRRPELDGWPESLPEPELSFQVDDAGQIITTATVANGDFIEVWDNTNGSDGHGGHVLGEWDGADDDDIEQAQEWLTGRHIGIAQQVRAEEKAAVERARARIMGQATGLAAPATDEELAAAVEHNGAAARQALRDMELASAGLAARKILTAHPGAETAELRTDSWDNGDFVAGAIVRDAAGNRLKEYFDDDEDNSAATKEVVGLLKNLDAEPHNSHWAGAFATGSYGEDLYTLDLKKASAWSPAGDLPAPAVSAAVEPAPVVAEERSCTNGPWCAAPRGKHVDGCTMEMM